MHSHGFGIRAASTLTLAAFMSQSLPVYAQAAGLSEQLYRQGQELMKENKIHDACAKFAAAYRADNTAVGALLATAACHEKEGKRAAAWGEYTAVASLAQRNGETDRAGYANDRAKALEPQLHHVVLATSFNIATAPEGFSVVLDGTTIDNGALNSQIPIDAGDHTLQVSAPGKTNFDKKFHTNDDTNTDTVAIPALADAPKNQQQTIIVKNEETSHINKTKLGFGIMFGVIGLAGVGAAIGLGLDASSLDTRSKTKDASGNLPSNADQLHSTAVTVQDGAIACGIVGGVALVTGAVFLILSPEKSQAAPPPTTAKVHVLPIIGPRMNGVGLGGTF